MLDVKKIKLKKNRIDEYTVAHVFVEGSKHLPAGIYFTKHYYYSPNNPDGGYFPMDKHERLNTLKDVKQWIAEYDDIEDARLAKIEEERKEYEAKRAAERAAEKAITDAYLVPVEDKPAIKVDDVVLIQEGTMSKPAHIGEALIKLMNPVDAKVVKVIEVSNEEFDAAAQDIYNNVPKEWFLLAGEKEHEFGGGYVGGFESDDPRIKDLEFNEVFDSGANERIFNDTKYCLVHALVAPNRMPLYINTEGYGYPRYVAKAA